MERSAGTLSAPQEMDGRLIEEIVLRTPSRKRTLSNSPRRGKPPPESQDMNNTVGSLIGMTPTKHEYANDLKAQMREKKEREEEAKRRKEQEDLEEERMLERHRLEISESFRATPIADEPPANAQARITWELNRELMRQKAREMALKEARDSGEPHILGGDTASTGALDADQTDGSGGKENQDAGNGTRRAIEVSGRRAKQSSEGRERNGSPPKSCCLVM